MAQQRFAGREIHIAQRAGERIALHGIGQTARIGNRGGDRDAHPGIGAERDHRLERRGIDVDALVVSGAVIGD